jgi:hypothetical protein
MDLRIVVGQVRLLEVARYHLLEHPPPSHETVKLLQDLPHPLQDACLLSEVLTVVAVQLINFFQEFFPRDPVVVNLLIEVCL